MDNLHLPKREAYKNIEKFELYELTNSVAFELAIRNKKVQELMANYYINRPNNEFDEAHIKYEDELEKKYFLGFSSIFYISKLVNKYRTNLEVSLYLEQCNSNDEITEYFSLSNEEKQKTLTTYFKSLNYNYEDIINKQKDFDKKSFNHLEAYTMVEDCDIINSYDIQKFIVASYIPALFSTRSVVPSDTDNGLFFVEKNPKTVISLKSFVKFRRPKLEVPIHISLELEVNLNLHLPKTELLSYIETLKDKYDSDNGLLETPIERINQKLNKNVKKNIDDAKVMSSSDWADAFYMYDVSKICKQGSEYLYEEIIEELTKYHGYKIKKAGASIYENKSYEVYKMFKDKYTNDTVKKYCGKTTIKERIKLMKNLIEDCGYRYLVSSIDIKYDKKSK